MFDLINCILATTDQYESTGSGTNYKSLATNTIKDYL